METRERIIVALDVPNLERAKPLVEDLFPLVGCFKVGLQLLTAVGAPQVIDWFMENGFGGGLKVFLDGKFCDIPNTVGAAARAASQLGVKMFNVHASAGLEAMKAAVENSSIPEIFDRKSYPPKGKSLVLAVTVLTSLDETIAQHIFGASPKIKVFEFVSDAKEAGVDGIICSPKELVILRAIPDFSNLLMVTPGIRPEWSLLGDQKRVMTPSEAILAGADMLVIGRPITDPPKEIGSPVEAVKRILDEIDSAP